MENELHKIFTDQIKASSDSSNEEDPRSEKESWHAGWYNALEWAIDQIEEFESEQGDGWHDLPPINSEDIPPVHVIVELCTVLESGTLFNHVAFFDGQHWRYGNLEDSEYVGMRTKLLGWKIHPISEPPKRYKK